MSASMVKRYKDHYVSWIDGTFRVTSPPGGPTHVEAVIPCAR
jgi:hypothetical protein